MRKLLTITTIIASLSGCSQANLDTHIPFVHRIDIQQGNVLEQSAVNQLKPGMSRREVRYILGSPLITDTFNANRWDYLYRMQYGDGLLDTQHLSLYFQDDRLVKIQGSLKPEEHPQQETAQVSETVTVPYREREPEGYLTRFWRWITFQSNDKI